MSSTTYNTIATILGVALLIALCVALYSFVFMVVRWKTPKRRPHIARLAYAVIAIPCLAGIQYAILFFVFLPALGREQMAAYNAARAARLAETSIVQVGDSAPAFSLTTADGNGFSLRDAMGDVVLINFFATWCGPCQVELPHVEQIWKERKNNKNFRLLVIGREESMESVRAFREKNGFSFPIAADPDRAVYTLYAKELIPRTLVVSPDGSIVYSQAGFSEDDVNELKAVLDEQLASLP